LKFEIVDTKQVGIEAKCRAYIREVIGSNLGRDNVYSGRGFIQSLHENFGIVRVSLLRHEYFLQTHSSYHKTLFSLDTKSVVK
jgi:hypothetical protein